MVSDSEIKKVLRYLLNQGQHTPNFVKGIEQLYRNECKHFKSEGFYKTLSPGMEATSEVYPYGWTSAKDLWDKHPEYAPIGVYHMNENTSELQESRGKRKFVQFPSLVASMMTVCEIVKHKGRFGTWFNNNDADETAYEQTLNSIIPRFTNEILNEQTT